MYCEACVRLYQDDWTIKKVSAAGYLLRLSSFFVRDKDQFKIKCTGCQPSNGNHKTPYQSRFFLFIFRKNKFNLRNWKSCRPLIVRNGSINHGWATRQTDSNDIFICVACNEYILHSGLQLETIFYPLMSRESFWSKHHNGLRLWHAPHDLSWHKNYWYAGPGWSKHLVYSKT